MPEKSVLDFFKTMEISTVKNQAACTSAKDYLENYDKNGSKYGKHKHYVGSNSALHTLQKAARAELFSNVTNLLEKNKDFLISLLNLTVYNYGDSEAVIQNLYTDCFYYFTTIFVLDDSMITGHLVSPPSFPSKLALPKTPASPKVAPSREMSSISCQTDDYSIILQEEYNALQKTYGNKVDIHIRTFELPILGRLIFPALMLGYSVCLIVHESEQLPFFAALGDLFKEAGSPESTYSLVGTDFPVAEQLLCIKDCSPQPFCPVLIFSDADMDSAVESCLYGAWKYKGNTLFTVTHIYIQEPIYENCVGRLKEKANLLKNSGLFQGSLRSEASKEIEVEQSGSLEVFQPSSTHSNRLFLGWDPRDVLDDKFYELGIAVMPFRTKEEAIALVNKSRFGCCSSVWTESINTANCVSSRLEVNTVWINSHGVIDPSVPLESQKESKIVLNGVSLMNYLRDFGRPQRNGGSNNSSDQGSSCKLPQKILDLNVKPLYLRKDVHSGVETARKAYKSLLKFDKMILLTFLNDLDPLAPCFEEEFGAYNMVEQLKGVFRKSRIDNNSRLLILKNMNVEWFSEPLGPIWVILSNMYESAFGDLVKLIYVSLTFNNSLIVTAYTEELQRLVYCAFKLFDAVGLPDGSLNYVQAKLSDIIPDASDLKNSCNSNARYINKVAFLDKEGSDKFPGFLGQYINVKMENTPDIPYDLYCYMPRVVWIPTL